MTKKLNFDATDADTLEASDFVGSHLYASGTLLTSSLVGSSQALDVNVANDISIHVDGIYDVSGNPLPDNVGLIANSRGASLDETSQIERLSSAAASSDAVVAANVHGLDVNSFGMVYNGTTWDRLKGTSGSMHVADGGGSLTVDAVDLDIRDLAAATDSVSAWTKDGSGNSISSTGGALDINLKTSSITLAVTTNDAALANTAIDNAATSIADTATKVVASDLSNRKYLFLHNKDNKIAYIGKQSGLSASNGFPIYPGVYFEARMGAAIALYGIAPTGSTVDMRNLQIS